MTVAAFLTNLRAKGVRIEAHGDRLRVVPAARVTPDELTRLRICKGEVLDILRSDDGLDETRVALLRATYRALPANSRARLGAASDAGNRLAEMVVQAVLAPPATTPCAWRIYAHRLDRELWIVRDADALAELETDAARAGLPVILADDLERLRDLDDLTMNRVLDTCAAWPGCRVADVMAEGTA